MGCENSVFRLDKEANSEVAMIHYHSNYVNEKYMEDFRQKTETEQKEACYLTSSCISVEFSLLLAFLGPLESSAVEKVREMSLQYPTMQEAVYLCNGAVSEKSLQIFRPPLPAEHVTVFSGRTDALEVRCDLTDRHTDPTTVTLLRMCAEG